jgi:glycerophosphoryl diester phosphodiesterase
MNRPYGIINESAKLVSVLNTSTQDFNKQLKKIGINDYVFPKDLKVESQHKNIIMLSLESFEKAFLSDKLNHLTPYITSLKNNSNWTYYPMHQNEGSKWTSGSLYTSLTGLPAYFGTNHNSIFQSGFHSNISSIGHILEKADYKKTFLIPNAKFSGTQELLYAHKINHIIDRSVLTSDTRDKDLFDQAKKEVLANSKTKQPFFMFLSTMSTHAPNGVYDARFESKLKPQNSPIEFMASATDLMVNDFISYLNDIDILKNTIIYIYPDHLKMGDEHLFNNTGDRELYVLTNAKKEDISYNSKKYLYQIDLPKLILEGAKIKHNAKFLTEYIKGDKNEYIKKHITELTELNISAFNRTDASPYLIPKISKHFNTYKIDTTRFIAHAGGIIDKYIYTNSLETLNKNYEQGFRYFELDIQTSTDGKFIAIHEWEEWSEISNYSGKTPVSEAEFLKHKIHNIYTPLNMELINKWFNTHKDAFLVTDKINNPEAFSNQFVDKNRLIMELFSWSAVKKASTLNINAVMPTQRVVFDLGKHAIDSLKKYNIKQVALSRTILESRTQLLKDLKQNNIKVFFYYLNYEIDRDENYVVKHEMDYIYGIYADKWGFEKEQ